MHASFYLILMYAVFVRNKSMMNCVNVCRQQMH